MPTTLHGKCYCGELEYEAVAPDARVIHCHCSGCRDWTGGAAYSAIPCESISFVKGTPKEFQRKGGPKKVFCGTCGTGICNRVVFGKITCTVAAGLLAESSKLETLCHCQMEDAVQWIDVSADGKPQHKGFP